jgi:hypothetical protein
VKIEGSGNISNIETPKVPLPDGFELYETKSQTKGKAGSGEKVFQYLLIPRKAGDFTLPGIELGFFDPKKGEYVARRTDPINIHVNEGDPGAEGLPPERLDPSKEISSPTKDSRHLFNLSEAGNRARRDAAGFFRGIGKWRVPVLIFIVLLFLCALAFLFRERLKRLVSGIGAEARGKKRLDREWSKIRQDAEEAQRLPFNQILKSYDFLHARLEVTLLRLHGVSVRGLTREQLQEALVERGVIAQNLWQRLSELLEFTETVRFASQAGAVSEDRARNELRKWIAECEAILSDLEPRKS